MHRSKDKNKFADEFPLLAKGGNSGKRIVSKDWTKNQIGPISKLASGVAYGTWYYFVFGNTDAYFVGV